MRKDHNKGKKVQRNNSLVKKEMIIYTMKQEFLVSSLDVPLEKDQPGNLLDKKGIKSKTKLKAWKVRGNEGYGKTYELWNVCERGTLR